MELLRQALTERPVGGTGAGASATHASEDTAIDVIASCALPILGAVIGYEVRHARWKPQVGVAPDGKGAYVGATVNF